MLTIPRFIWGDEVPLDHPVDFVKYSWCIERTLSNWTEYQIKWLTYWFNHGASVTSIARRCGRDYATVYNKLDELRLITKQYSAWKPSYVRLAETMSNREIADHTCCSISTVKRNLSDVRKRQLLVSENKILELSKIMSNTEIAKQLGMSRNTVIKRISNAKSRLQPVSTQSD